MNPFFVLRMFGIIIFLGGMVYLLMNPSLIGVIPTVLGLILAFLSYVEKPVRKWRKTEVILPNEKKEKIKGREEIYERNIQFVRSAKKQIRLMSPTSSWGTYSVGLKIFEEIYFEIKRAIRERDVSVKIACDIFDWERARFAVALLETQADVKHKPHEKWRYFLIKDDDEALIMHTDPDRIYVMKGLERNIRQLKDEAELIHDPKEIKALIKEFDDVWSNEKLVTPAADRIRELLQVICPNCKANLGVRFYKDSIELKS